MFFVRHLSKMLVITGIGTAAAFLYAFWPEWTLANVGKLPFTQDDIIIVRHWGIMVGLMGVFMVCSAFCVAIRPPILLYSAIEKSFMVYYIVLNIGEPYAGGFYAAGAMDSIVVLWTIAYWIQRRSFV